MPQTYAHLTLRPDAPQRFDYIVVVSHMRHVEDADLSKHDTLYVCCDWLLWHACHKRGLHCLHLEAGTLEDAKTAALQDDFFLRSNAWVYRDGVDQTHFNGISIGKLFTREVSLVLLSCYQIRTALDWFYNTFQPKHLIVYDLRTEFGLVDDEMKHRIIGDIDRKHNGVVEDRLSSVAQQSLEFPFTRDFRVRPMKPAKMFSKGKMFPKEWRHNVLRRVYARTMSFIFSMRPRDLKKAPLVLILPTGPMTGNLLEHLDQSKTPITPLLLAERENKSSRFLSLCWKNGAQLSYLPSVALTSNDTKKVTALKDAVHSLCENLAEGVEGDVQLYVRNHVAQSSDIQHLCRSVKRAESLFDRLKPQRLVTTEHMNPGTREFIEVAYQRGCAVDFFPHGMRISRQRHDTMTGDQHTPAMIDRLLGWGVQAESYLKDTQAKTRFAKVGYPGIDGLRKKDFSKRASKTKTALILPYSADTEGLVNMSSLIYPLLLDTIRTVRQHGYQSVRVKIHPGSLFNRSYYDRVLAILDEPVELIHQAEGLQAHLDWADIVVGPIVSSTYVETLAADKPYYPYLTQPTVNNSDYLHNVNVLSDAQDLDRALRDTTEEDYAAHLDYFCATTTIENASVCFWDAIANPEPSS